MYMSFIVLGDIVHSINGQSVSGCTTEEIIGIIEERYIVHTLMYMYMHFTYTYYMYNIILSGVLDRYT